MIIWTMGELSRLRDNEMLPLLRPKCFKCGETLTVPLVVWSGNDSDDEHPLPNAVGLHPRCAEELGATLLSDGQRAQGKEGPQA